MAAFRPSDIVVTITGKVADDPRIGQNKLGPWLRFTVRAWDGVRDQRFNVFVNGPSSPSLVDKILRGDIVTVSGSQAMRSYDDPREPGVSQWSLTISTEASRVAVASRVRASG